MPVIHTKNNRVVADDPEPTDAFVHVAWFGSAEDGSRRGVFLTPPQSIDEYQDAVDWAVGMADELAHPLYVVPMRYRDLISRERAQGAFDSMTGQERGKLRACVVKAMAEVMRDSDDWQVRAEAYEVLKHLKVVTP